MNVYFVELKTYTFFLMLTAAVNNLGGILFKMKKKPNVFEIAECEFMGNAILR